MKYLLALLFFVSLSPAQQKEMNPDGYIGGFSLHFTPMFTYYSADIFDSKGDKYAENSSPNKFDFAFKVKAPVSHAMTLSFFFEYLNQSYTYSEISPVKFNNEITGYAGRFGGTISIYFRGD